MSSSSEYATSETFFPKGFGTLRPPPKRTPILISANTAEKLPAHSERIKSFGISDISHKLSIVQREFLRLGLLLNKS